jgi:hypothetical protein
MPLTKIKSLGITDGTIVNADINASAAIDSTKLSGISSDFVKLATTQQRFCYLQLHLMDIFHLIIMFI